MVFGLASGTPGLPSSTTDPPGRATEKRLLSQPANLVLRLAATDDGTNADTSPPIAAIWRTSVAVIGRTATEAGTNTQWTPGAMVSFMPDICIS